MAKKKSKSMTGKDSGRKLATGAGRAKQKSANEKKKPATGPRKNKTGSYKQRKG